MIRARHLHDADENYEAVVLVDDVGFSFSIQRALEFDEQDRVAGMDFDPPELDRIDPLVRRLIA